MTTLVFDAKRNLEQSGTQFDTSTVTSELLYADDTLLIDSRSDVIEAYMSQISLAGQVYGLAFNWSKLEVLPINCACVIPGPDGSPVKQKDRIVYLGSLLC